jgi:hypothetical protein
MPYINPIKRTNLIPELEILPMDAGELNFVFTQVIQQYLMLNGTSYQRINDVIGALEGAKLEFYRRVAAPYEDMKIKENGDVY